MHSNNVSSANGASAGTGGTYQAQEDSCREDSPKGAAKTSNISPMMIVAGLGFAAGATYLLSRLISSLNEVSQSQESPQASGSRRPDRPLTTVDHFNRLSDERLREFKERVVDNLKILGFTVEKPTEDIFSGSTREEIRQRINAKFKKAALVLHPDKCPGRDDSFKMAANARDDLLRRLSGPDVQTGFRVPKGSGS